MDDQLQASRSQRIEPAVMSPEFFTIEDYHEARALEDIFDSLARDDGELSVDAYAQPKPGRFEAAEELLGFEVTKEMKEAALNLLTRVDMVSSQIGTSPFVHLLPTEANAYDPKYDRTEGGPIKPFAQQLRYYVARFCAEHVERQEYNGTHDSKQQKYLTAFSDAQYQLESVPGHASQLYTVDIPAYTTLYNFFDRQRGLDDNQLEVYLGRDGIYAYYGRLGEVAARGDTEQVLARNAEVIIPARMLYMVYSRSIKMDNVEMRRNYIKQHINENDSPHFYDTGYVGTIPEDIMKILGYSSEEINKRIHLLNTTYDSRRVEGLNDNINIERIENGPKPENSSQSLRKTKTNKIGYTADISKIEEQFQFLVMRSILIRHFWIKEYEEITQHLADAAFL